MSLNIIILSIWEVGIQISFLLIGPGLKEITRCYRVW